MENIIDLLASAGQRLLIPNVANAERQPRILKEPAHRNLAGLVAGEYDNLLRVLRQQLANELVSP
ncbi:hypothetical protein D3C84_1078120 [compost metagenome]